MGGTRLKPSRSIHERFPVPWQTRLPGLLFSGGWALAFGPVAFGIRNYGNAA